jgi:aspartate aminotransferase
VAEHPRTIAIVGAVSKSMCMTGWRVGWALTHPDLIKAMSKNQARAPPTSAPRPSTPPLPP